MDVMKPNGIDPRKVKTNRKLGLTLALIAAAFFLGVILRRSLFGA
jgi:hypothetical protein